MVTITVDSERRDRLVLNCTAQEVAREYIAAALRYILDHKTALGLAVAPPATESRRPESERELRERALEERRERAKTERMKIESSDPSTPWTEYRVTSLVSGKQYRAVLRGLGDGQKYCSCPDFRTNTLATCKHLLKLEARVKAKFDAATLKKPFKLDRVEVHVSYREEPTLRLTLPARCDATTREQLEPYTTGPITNARKLIADLEDLTRRGVEFRVFPDAEEFIQQTLYAQRVSHRVAEIRKDPGKHPLRTSLLKVPLLPYQMDGIAFVVGRDGRSWPTRWIGQDDPGDRGGGIVRAGGEHRAGVGGLSGFAQIAVAAGDRQFQRAVDADRFRPDLRARRAVQGGRVLHDLQLRAGVARLPLRRRHAVGPDHSRRGTADQELGSEDVAHDQIAQVAVRARAVGNAARKPPRRPVLRRAIRRRPPPGPRLPVLPPPHAAGRQGEVARYRNLDELRENLRPVLLRRTRDSVRLELPERTEQILRIAPSKEQKDLHDVWLQTVAEIVSKKFLTEMDLMRLRMALLMCRMAADGTYLVDKKTPNHSTKLERLVEIFEEFADAPDRKAVLFSEWTTMLDLIEPSLKKLGYGLCGWMVRCRRRTGRRSCTSSRPTPPAGCF